jgi:Arc/MetJ family transcription regulator
MPTRRKKTWLLDQSLIQKVRRIYGVRTETEAVTRALKDVVFQNELQKALQATAGTAPKLEKVF